MTASPSLLLIRQKYTPYGGAERFVERAMAALVEQGVSLSLLTREWQGAAEGVEVIPCRPFYLGRLWRDKSFHRAACGKVEELAPSLVQSHERISCCDIYRAGDGLHGQWLHHKKRASGPLTRLALDWSPYHRYVLQAEERLFTSPRLKAVICNSYMVQKEIRQQFKLPVAMLPVIYSGVDSERFHPRLRQARQRVREAWGIPQQAVVFLFVGSGFKRKGMDISLKTFA
ncbi:MAG: glycosyltransferase family 4 protein, partial [Magnetococcales bacterium]|nr:glycosyltransferase family 4 protein [Magnetococcales bacterium]